MSHAELMLSSRQNPSSPKMLGWSRRAQSASSRASLWHDTHAHHRISERPNRNTSARNKGTESRRGGGNEEGKRRKRAGNSHNSDAKSLKLSPGRA